MAKPTIRFRGFDYEWEQRKFGEIVEKYEDPIETPTEGYTRLGIRSHAKGTFHSYVEKGKELETAKMFRVAADKFIVNITFGWEHAVAITDENDAGKLVSHRFPQYSFNAGMNPNFFRYLILDENFKHHLELSSPGGAGRNRVLKLSDMLEYKMNFPSEAEQKKIAAYFDDLDNLITLHQRKCDETKKLKKYMLQKMFPQNGSKVPEIRFKGFTDEWEQRKLGDIAEFSKGSGYSKGDLIESGTPIILYGRLYTKYETSISEVDTYVEAKDGSVYSKGGEVIVPASGETAEDIARAATVDKSGVILGGDLNVVSPNEDINSAFLAISISHGNSQRELAKKAQGKSVVHIHNEEIKNLVVPFPAKAEQNKIVEYFSNFDNLITLHQHKCEELKKLKKFMLQNMFTQKNK